MSHKVEHPTLTRWDILDNQCESCLYGVTWSIIIDVKYTSYGYKLDLGNV